MRNPNISGRAVFVFIVFLLPMIFLGCGRKDAPMAPGQPAVDAVADLQAAVNGSLVELTWHQTGEPGNVKGYNVYRAETALDKDACAGCPQVFKKMTLVDRQARTDAYTFADDTTQPGFRYTYKLQTVLTDNAAGPRSNSVSIDRPKHDID